jgi:3-oxoacyl-[acyl-carrier protein] reductase
MLSLADRIAIVTGAGSGIGAAIAECFAAAGAVAWATDRDGAAAEATARRIRDAGHRAEALALDVGDEASAAWCRRMADATCWSTTPASGTWARR